MRHWTPLSEDELDWLENQTRRTTTMRYHRLWLLSAGLLAAATIAGVATGSYSTAACSGLLSSCCLVAGAVTLRRRRARTSRWVGPTLYRQPIPDFPQLLERAIDRTAHLHPPAPATWTEYGRRRSA